MDYKIDKATKRRDERGFLVDFLKGNEGQRSVPLGQIYFVTFEKTGAIRGNHYHTTKNEWFVAVEGVIRVILEDIKTKERVELTLNGNDDAYERVYVGKNVAHAFINVSPRAMMIDYADKPYHDLAPDTIFYKLDIDKNI